MNWQAVEDGYIVTANMTDQEVWLRCETFGAPALAEALQNFIDSVD